MGIHNKFSGEEQESSGPGKGGKKKLEPTRRVNTVEMWWGFRAGRLWR